MFFAGLKDIQHQPHTLYIDRYPAGREATVAWPSLDLKFENDTKYGVLVQAYIVKGTPSRQGSITVKMWSTKTYDKITSSDLVAVELHHRPRHQGRLRRLRADDSRCRASR
jgi:vancomycin resistance protein YoaR